MTKLNVVHDRYTNVTRQANPEDRWDRDDTSTNWSVYGIKLSDDQQYGDVTADFEVNVGDTIYLVYAIYSTGDSFGHDADGSIDFITVHKDRKIAEENAELLRRKTQASNYDDWNVDLTTDSGVVIHYHCPWLSYFESLSSVHVIEFSISK